MDKKAKGHLPSPEDSPELSTASRWPPNNGSSVWRAVRELAHLLSVLLHALFPNILEARFLTGSGYLCWNSPGRTAHTSNAIV